MGKTAVVQLRLTPEEKAKLVAEAQADGRSLAAWVRRRLLGAMRAPTEVRPAPMQKAVVRASELPAVDVPEGAVCSFQVRHGVCGKPAKFARGTLWRCEEH